MVIAEELLDWLGIVELPCRNGCDMDDDMDADSGCGTGWTGVSRHYRFYGEDDESYALRLGEKVCAIRQDVLSCVAVRSAAAHSDALCPAAPPAPLTPSEPTDLDLWCEGDPVARALYGPRGPPGVWDESELWADQLADQIADYDGYDGCSYSHIGPW